MHFIEDFSDQRNKANCIHCDRSLTVAETNKDHVPTKSLLSKVPVSVVLLMIAAKEK